jgi:hypothetical protein
VSWPTRVGLWLVSIPLAVVWGACVLDTAEAQERYTPVSRGELRATAAISEAFPSWAVPSFVRIARCESEFDPGARSHGWDVRWGRYDYRGILQVSVDHHQWRADRLFWPGADLYDPRVNAHVAAEVFNEQGWGAWPYCRRFA